MQLTICSSKDDMKFCIPQVQLNQLVQMFPSPRNLQFDLLSLNVLIKQLVRTHNAASGIENA